MSTWSELAPAVDPGLDRGRTPEPAGRRHRGRGWRARRRGADQVSAASPGPTPTGTAEPAPARRKPAFSRRGRPSLVEDVVCGVFVVLVLGTSVVGLWLILHAVTQT